ncbi:MAG TPA: flagellar FlbD family protein [Vicinamibacterales bacterium]|nr:flagellar FlbD family protein [Vicinamibacterales bacterium]
MIAVTRLDGTPMLLNIEHIESIEQTPDTMISLAGGTKLLVRETPDELVERVLEFKRAVTRGDFPREAGRLLAVDPVKRTSR